MKTSMLIAIMALLLIGVVAAQDSTIKLYSPTMENKVDIKALSFQFAWNYQLTGRLQDSNGNYMGENIPVVLSCVKSGETFPVVSTTTAADGSFDAFVLKSSETKSCTYGDEIFFTVAFDGVDYKSDKIVLEKTINMGRSALVDTSNDAAVPEFNTLTFGLAIIAAGLGFVLLRKN
jgi:hypothetical protein